MAFPTSWRMFKETERLLEDGTGLPEAFAVADVQQDAAGEEEVQGVPLDGSRGALSLIKDTPRVALESQPVS